MRSHFDSCPVCGHEFHASVKGDTTVQIDNAQICIYEAGNGAWIFCHAVGGGAKTSEIFPDNSATQEDAENSAEKSDKGEDT